MRTYTPRASEIERTWYVVDAEGLTLGRMSTEVARVLRGKHKATFTPHIDTGDHVIIVNADKVVLTSGKAEKKMVHRHTGYPGGIRSTTYADELDTKPADAVRRTVRGMIPKNRLGRQQLKKLKVYAGPEHPHSAQKPQPLASTLPEPVRNGVPTSCLSRSSSPPVAASAPSPASASVRAPAPSRSTSARSRTTSRTPTHRMILAEPLRLTETGEAYDIDATLHGGGVTGQAGAVRLGIARGLIALDPELRGALKRAGFLSRDAREKESKKYGLKKARKAPQYSKR